MGTWPRSGSAAAAGGAQRRSYLCSTASCASHLWHGRVNRSTGRQSEEGGRRPAGGAWRRVAEGARAPAGSNSQLRCTPSCHSSRLQGPATSCCLGSPGPGASVRRPGSAAAMLSHLRIAIPAVAAAVWAVQRLLHHRGPEAPSEAPAAADQVWQRCWLLSGRCGGAPCQPLTRRHPPATRCYRTRPCLAASCSTVPRLGCRRTRARRCRWSCRRRPRAPRSCPSPRRRRSRRSCWMWSSPCRWCACFACPVAFLTHWAWVCTRHTSRGCVSWNRRGETGWQAVLRWCSLSPGCMPSCPGRSPLGCALPTAEALQLHRALSICILGISLGLPQCIPAWTVHAHLSPLASSTPLRCGWRCCTPLFSLPALCLQTPQAPAADPFPAGRAVAGAVPQLLFAAGQLPPRAGRP